LPVFGLPVTAQQQVLNTQQLLRDVEVLAADSLEGRLSGSQGNKMAQEYLIGRFSGIGLQPYNNSYRHTFRLESRGVTVEEAVNLVGYIPGKSDKAIVITAHYDHVGVRKGEIYNGADDNASAVAILLETARRLPRLKKHPLLFVAFNAEEPPYIRTDLMGSQFFVDHLPAEIGRPSQLHAVMIMDLMGGAHWTPLRDVVFAAGAEMSPGLYQRLKELSSPLTPDASHLTVLPLEGLFRM
jgi:Zn-dependent M28 family amino/carboxypeptidase